MKSVITLAGVAVASGAMVLSLASPVLAWHPEGEIVKEVQNVTQGSELADANTADTAIGAQPGDTLEYVITVRNDGDSGRTNEMHYTEAVDQLPAGLELIDGQTDKSLGVIEPGESKQYSFRVKVTSEQDNSVICNTASFTGDSEVNDNPQSGDDDACVHVTVPPEPSPEPEPQPEPTPKPEEPKGKGELPEEIPATGAGAALSAILGASSLVGAGHAYLRSRRFLQ